MSEEKPNGQNGRNIVARLYFPNNDNLIPMLRNNIGDVLMEYAGAMIEYKDYHQQVVPINGGSAVELVSCRGEDIARKIIENANNSEVGITGSDFVLANVLGKPNQFYKFRRRQVFGSPTLGEDILYTELRFKDAGVLYVRDLGDIVRADLKPGDSITFAGEQYWVDMFILNTPTTPPFLCVCGAKDIEYAELIRKRKSEGKKVTVAHEFRFGQLVEAFLAKEERKQGIGFDVSAYSGTTEAHMRHGGESEEEGRADIGIDIVQTGDTLDKNDLRAYQRIMRTYPVQVTCYTTEDKREKLTLERIREMLSKSHNCAPA